VDSFLAALAEEINDLLAPAREGVGGPDEFNALLAELGWQATSTTALSGALNELKALESALAAIEQAAQALVQTRATGNASASQVAALVQTALTAFASFGAAYDDLKSVNFGGLASPFDQKDFWAPASGRGFPELLLDLLVWRYLRNRAPQVHGLLTFTGILSAEAKAPSGTGRAPYIERAVNWDRLPDLVADPPSLLRKAYGWSTAEFDHRRFLENLAAALTGFGVAATVKPPSQYLDVYYPPGSDLRGTLAELDAQVLATATDDGIELDVATLKLHALPIPARTGSGGFPGGIALFPVVDGKLGTAPLRLSDALALTVGGEFAAQIVTVEIRPGNATVEAGAAASLSAFVRLDAAPQTPWVLLGTPDASRIELAMAHATITAKGSISGGFEYRVEAVADEAAIVIALGEGDAFLQKTLGGSPQRLDFGVGVQWSSVSGFRFEGQTRLEVNLPVHRSLAGVVDVDTVGLAFGAGSDGSSLIFEATATGALTLGPFVAKVDRVGAKLSLVKKTDGSGNLGPVDLFFGFRPPTGLGIGVDAGPVVGGGFISFDPDKGRYAGFLQLGVAGIQIKAIGLLDTKLPGGQPGYSFLIIVSGEFPPIQLGFGFTLNGVGGLAGIQRTMVVDALQAGIRNHSVDHILFPEDPIRDAPQIISDLQTIFPPQQGRYVFGPMAIIGYGTPALVEAELGILLEVPAPVRLVLLGQISAILPPKPKEAGAAAEKLPPGLELHLDVLGIVDFGKRTVSLDAVLHDSKLAEFPLFGDMALRASFGDEPAFAFAIGGFNPRFTPPPAFPALRRLTLAVSQNGNPQALLQCYLALTSNSLQFGARGDLTATKLGFSFAGWLGFDVLVVISPLSFVADLTAAVEVRRGAVKIASVALEATLTGPTPWHLQGRASFDFIVRVTVPIELTVGEAVTAEIPPADPWQLLQPALEDARNWNALPGPAAFRVCSLREPPGLTGPLIDPLGGVQVHQRVCPLNRRLERFGEVPPKDHDRFDVKAVSPDPKPPSFQLVQDYFAPAQFEALSDAERLSRPGFEKMDAGVSLVSNAIDLGAGIGDTVSFDTTIVDAPDGVAIGDLSYVPQDGASYDLPAARQTATLAGSAGGRSPLSASGEQRFAPAADHEAPAALVDEAFLIVDRDSLKRSADFTEPIVGKGAAFQALDGYLRGHPEAWGKLQVIPEHELLVA
jgi:hypothetical protein